MIQAEDIIIDKLMGNKKGLSENSNNYNSTSINQIKRLLYL